MKPETDQRLSDHISIGVLTRVFPPDLVDGVIDGSGRTEQRHRLLSARVVYYVLGSGPVQPVLLRRGHTDARGGSQLGP